MDAGLALLSYLLGSIPTAYIVARALGRDITRFGDRNIGATNAYFATGKAWVFLVVLLVDAGKVFIPTALLGPWYGFLAIVGHVFSIFTFLLTGRVVSGAGTAPIVGFALAYDWRLIPLALAYFAAYVVLMSPENPWTFFKKERGYTGGIGMIWATTSTYQLFFGLRLELFTIALFVSLVYAYKLRQVWRNVLG